MKDLEYYCTKCKRKITNGECIVWKKSKSTDVFSLPYCKVCKQVVKGLPQKEANV